MTGYDGYDWLVVLILLGTPSRIIDPSERHFSNASHFEVSRRLVPLGVLKNQTQKAHKERNTVVEPKKPVELFRGLNAVQNQTYSDWLLLTSMNSFLVEISACTCMYWGYFGLCCSEKNQLIDRGKVPWSGAMALDHVRGPLKFRKADHGISEKRCLSCFISISCNFLIFFACQCQQVGQRHSYWHTDWRCLKSILLISQLDDLGASLDFRHPSLSGASTSPTSVAASSSWGLPVSSGHLRPDFGYLRISLDGFVWKCWVNIPNEIAIFHRDHDQQNHWLQWGTNYIFRQTRMTTGWHLPNFFVGDMGEPPGACGDLLCQRSLTTCSISGAESWLILAPSEVPLKNELIMNFNVDAISFLYLFCNERFEVVWPKI